MPKRPLPGKEAGILAAIRKREDSPAARKHDAERARADAAAACLTALGIPFYASSDYDGHPDLSVRTEDAETVEYLLRWARSRGATLTREWCFGDDRS